MSALTIEARDGAARTGRLRTAHGEVRTPAFMPVGTHATVKSLDPDEVRACGADIVLCNAYHLALRPGVDLVERAGGLHAFMGWDGPILTDSGGFQLVSLRAVTAVDEDGRHLRLAVRRQPAAGHARGGGVASRRGSTPTS